MSFVCTVALYMLIYTTCDAMASHVVYISMYTTCDAMAPHVVYISMYSATVLYSCSLYSHKRFLGKLVGCIVTRMIGSVTSGMIDITCSIVVPIR